VRAREPDITGDVTRAGVRVYYEVFGAGAPNVLLLPTWSIVDSRHWKFQIPDLARRHRVVTFDGRGNGRSDRPPAGYDVSDFAADALAVMDATQTPRAVLVSLSMGAQWALTLAAEHPERVAGVVFIAPSVPFGEPAGDRPPWDERLDTDEGWARYNRYSWLRDYRGFLQFFFAQVFTEPHSTKPIDDCIEWGLQTTPKTLVAIELAHVLDAPAARELSARVSCPALVIHGTEDAVSSPAGGIALAEATNAELVLLDGSGHAPHVRSPVRVNLLLRRFLSERVDRAAGPANC
jgi:pimeloyl-ACP methyl ester carboxylesterase